MNRASGCAEPGRDGGNVTRSAVVGRFVQLRTSDDVRLEARQWVAPPPRRGTVVLVHGFGAGGGEAKVVALAEALREAGFDVLAYDSRGHGGSDGEATLGDRERLDVEAAVGAVQGPGPIVLVGASMGAIAALRYAATSPSRVAGIVAVSCPSAWRLPKNARGVLTALLTQTAVGRDLARRHMGVRIARPGRRAASPVELVRGLDVPLAIVHGRGDPFIACGDAELLYDTASEPRRLELVDGLGHAFEPLATAPVLAAVDWCLGPAVTAGPLGESGTS